jgi:hypothetical protein
MSWGYWGIVAGLAVLVATLFVCLAIVYSDSKTSADASAAVGDRSGDKSQEPATGGRRAA